MKHISPDRAILRVVVGVLPLAFVAGCSAGYFQSLTQASRVFASVNTPAEISVPALTDQNVELTNPKVQFTLSTKSSPVTITGVTRMVYTATGTANTLQPAITVTSKSGTGTTAILLKQSIVLPEEKTSVNVELPAVWSQLFLDSALPESGRPAADSPRTWFVDVTLEGTNQLGQTITTNVGIPINIIQQSGGA